MDEKSVAQLRLDRRLIGRRGWISQKDLEAALKALPDRADNIAPPEDEDTGSSPAEDSED